MIIPANTAFRCLKPSPLFVLLMHLFLIIGCAANTDKTGYSRGSPVENQLLAEIALQRGQYLVAVQEYLSLAEKSDNPEHARRATELAYDYGYIVYALTAAERWVELDPASTDAHAYLGRLYVRRNQPEQAFLSLDLSLGAPQGRTNRDYLLLSGELTLLAAPARGLQVFSIFNDVYPDQAAITASVATLAFQAGDTDRAVNMARKTVQLVPDWMMARVWLANFLLGNGDRASAFEQMAFALEMSPGLEMELEFIKLLALANEQQDAMQRLERLFERYPGDPDLLRMRGELSLEWGDYDQTTADFSMLLSEAYFVSESFWFLGQAAFRQEDYLQAIRYFQRVGEGPWQNAAVNAISRAYLALGDADTALAAQGEFVARHPQQTFVQLPMRADILTSAGRSQEALETIAAAIEYDPWNEGLWLYQGGLLEPMGESAQAINSFRRAHELAPDNPLTLNALGYSLTLAQQDYADAFGYISRALELQPDNPAIMDSMGWLLYLQGDTAAARGWLEQAYELLQDPEIAAHLGEVLWVQGEQEKAREVWSDSLTRYPDSKVLQETTNRFLK